MLFRLGLYTKRGCHQRSDRTPRHKNMEVAPIPEYLVFLETNSHN